MTNVFRTLIADDELLARERLKRLLSNHKNVFQIIGEAENGDDTLLYVESLKPDLLFLDIQMPGKSIFDVLTDASHKPFVVFCTAYDQYALQAFDAHSVDYLLKPVEEERLGKTIEKLRKIVSPAPVLELQNLVKAIQEQQGRKKPTTIPCKIGDRTILVKLERVVCFLSDEKYVNYFDVLGNEYLTDIPLKNLEDKLPENFIRISKSTIINKDYVKEIQKYFRGKAVFIMDDSKRTKLISGGFYAGQIKDNFEF